MLSHVAQYFDPAMLVVQNLEYASANTILFQRLSVMATDVVFISAAYMLARDITMKHGRRRGLVLFFLLVCNAGLLLVDHIHFQYNGVLMGLLMWSVYFMHRGWDWLSGVVFTVLFNMKHLFVYLGPVYFVQISRHWCAGNGAVGWTRFVAMGVTVVLITWASLGPWIMMGQALQLAARMFPFGRGLTHAYWAGNFWALYVGADKVLGHLVPGAAAPHGEGVDVASGQVGVARLHVLPHIEPEVAFLAVMAALVPAAISLWRSPQPQRFACAVAYTCLSSFWFGYHVHEKAVITAIIPLAIPAVISSTAAEDFIVLSCAGHYGLLPLFFHAEEYPIKLMIVVLFYLFAAHGLADIHCNTKEEGPANPAQPVSAFHRSNSLVDRDRPPSSSGAITPLLGRERATSGSGLPPTAAPTAPAWRPSPLGMGAGPGAAPVAPGQDTTLAGMASQPGPPPPPTFGKMGSMGHGMQRESMNNSLYRVYNQDSSRRASDSGGGLHMRRGSDTGGFSGERHSAGPGSSGLIHRAALAAAAAMAAPGPSSMPLMGAGSAQGFASTPAFGEPAAQQDPSRGGSQVPSRRQSDYGTMGGGLGGLSGGMAFPGPGSHDSPPGSVGGGARLSEMGGGRMSEMGGMRASHDGSVNFVLDDPAAGPKYPMSLSRLLGAGPLLPFLPALYCAGFVPLELYCSLLHAWLLSDRLPFLPLMMTSMYCALGVGWVWVRMMIGYANGRSYL